MSYQISENLQVILTSIHSVEDLSNQIDYILGHSNISDIVRNILSRVNEILNIQEKVDELPHDFRDHEKFPKPAEYPKLIRHQSQAFSDTYFDIILLPEKPTIYVGDLHGNAQNLIKMLKKTNFFENAEQQYVFLGDYIDRGNEQVKTVLMLLILKILFSHQIVLLQGNHEYDRSRINQKNSTNFTRALFVSKLHEMSEDFETIFQSLPIMAFTVRGTIAIHGAPFTGERDYASLHEFLTALEPYGPASLVWSELFPTFIPQNGIEALKKRCQQVRQENLEEGKRELDIISTISRIYQGECPLPTHSLNVLRGTTDAYLVDPCWLLTRLRLIPGFKTVISSHQHCNRYIKQPPETGQGKWIVIDASSSFMVIIVENAGKIKVHNLESDEYTSYIPVTSGFTYQKPVRNEELNVGSLIIHPIFAKQLIIEKIPHYLNLLLQHVHLFHNSGMLSSIEATYIIKQFLEYLHTNESIQYLLQRGEKTLVSILDGSSELDLRGMLEETLERGMPPIFLPQEAGYLLNFRGEIRNQLKEILQKIYSRERRRLRPTDHYSISFLSPPRERREEESDRSSNSEEGEKIEPISSSTLSLVK